MLRFSPVFMFAIVLTASALTLLRRPPNGREPAITSGLSRYEKLLSSGRYQEADWLLESLSRRHPRAFEV